MHMARPAFEAFQRLGTGPHHPPIKAISSPVIVTRSGRVGGGSQSFRWGRRRGVKLGEARRERRKDKALARGREINLSRDGAEGEKKKKGTGRGGGLIKEKLAAPLSTNDSVSGEKRRYLSVLASIKISREEQVVSVKIDKALIEGRSKPRERQSVSTRFRAITNIAK